VVEKLISCLLLGPPVEDLRLNSAVFKWPDSILAVVEQSKSHLASCTKQAEDALIQR